MKKWKQIQRDAILKSEWLSVYKDIVENSNGRKIDDYYTVELKDAVLIVALDQQNNVILKKEYRYAHKMTLIECPAGGIEKGETPLEAAQRELKEETGYTSNQWTLLSKTFDETSKCTNTMYLFLAENVERKDLPSMDENEEIEILCIPFSRAIEMILEKEIVVNSTISALFLTKEKYKR